MGNGQTKAGGEEVAGGGMVMHHQQAPPEAAPAPAAPTQHSEAEVAKANAQNRPPSGPRPTRKAADAPKGQLVPPNRVHEMMQRTSDSEVGNSSPDSKRPQAPAARPQIPAARPSGQTRPSSVQSPTRPPMSANSTQRQRPGSTPGTVGRDPRRGERASSAGSAGTGYLARASQHPDKGLSGVREDNEEGSESDEERQLIEEPKSRSVKRRPSSGGSRGVAAAMELRQSSDKHRGERSMSSMALEFGTLGTDALNPGFGLGDSDKGERPGSGHSGASGVSRFSEDSVAKIKTQRIANESSFEAQPDWTYTNTEEDDIMEALSRPSEFAPGTTVIQKADQIKSEVEQRQWHMAVKRSVEEVSHVLAAITRRETMNKEQQAELQEAARNAATARKTEADDLSRKHQVADQNDEERMLLAKKRAHSIFNAEKSKITNQLTANSEAAKLERTRIDNAMKKVEDKMVSEQKRLRKENDERVQQMMDSRRVKLDAKKTELMGSLEDTHSQWVKGLKDIEERQVDAMYQVQKTEALVVKRENELADLVAEVTTVQSRLDGLIAAESDRKRAVSEEELALAKTVAELDSEASTDTSISNRLKTEVEEALQATRRNHELAAQADRDLEAKLAYELHLRKEDRTKQREELQRKEDEAVKEGEKRLAEMSVTRKSVSERCDNKRNQINQKKSALRKEDNEDDADLASVEAKIRTLMEAHDEQCKREVGALREQLRPQREKWETALDGTKGEVKQRDIARVEAEEKAAEELGIKRAELDEAERRLTVHRDALEAEMVAALAMVADEFQEDITKIQRTATEVEAHCAADRKKVESEALAMRQVLDGARQELDKEKASHLQEQANLAAGLEHMKGRVPVMEKDVHSLEGEVAAAAKAKKVLEDADSEKLMERRQALSAEQPGRLDALRKAHAAERRDLEARHKALEDRRKGEQGAALRQMQKLEEVKRVAGSIEETLALQDREVMAERRRRDMEVTRLTTKMDARSTEMQNELAAAEAQGMEDIRSERARLEAVGANLRANVNAAKEAASRAEAEASRASEMSKQRLEKIDREMAEAEAAIAKNSLSLADKRDRVGGSVSGSSDIQDDAEVQKLLHKAAILKVELGMIPVQLKLPLAKLLEMKFDLEEEDRQHQAAAARNRSEVRQAELAVRAHEAVQTRVLEEMQLQLQASMEAIKADHSVEREQAAGSLQAVMARNMAWSEDATMHLEIVRTQASSTIASLRSEEQNMTDNRTDAQMAFGEECSKLADDEESFVKREAEELQQLEASVDKAVADFEEDLQAKLRTTPEHIKLTALEQRLVGEAAALRSHLEAIANEEERLEQFAEHVQKRIAAGEVSLAEQVSKVEEVVSKAFVALDDRNKERRKDVLLLESQLQDKMEARKGDHLETIRQKCLKRDAVELPRVTKLTAEFQVAKKGIDARLAKVDRERAEDAKLVEAESKQLSERIAQQEQQVSAIEQRFAKQRGEVQAELASKRSEVNGRRAARDEERKVLDEALAELDAALADVESAIQAEKEKQVTFQTQLRQQARQLIEDNTNDDNETQAMLENLKSECETRIASETQELEDLRSELEGKRMESVSKLSEAEAARATQKAAAEARLAATKRAADDLTNQVAEARKDLKSKMDLRKKGGELLDDSRAALKHAELQVRRNRNVLEMEGSRINDDRSAVEEDTKLELELLEQEYSQYEETVQAEGAKSLEEAMANTAEAASSETAARAEEWAAFEERMYHEKAHLDAELRDSEEELRDAVNAIDHDALNKAKVRVAEERRLVEQHLSAERKELLKEKLLMDKYDEDMHRLLELLLKKKQTLEEHQDNVDRAEARAAEEARNKKLMELEALMEAERHELQQREMREMLEATRIAEAQRAAELQMQHTMKALEAQKLAFEEQALQKQRAAEHLRHERSSRLSELQRQLDKTRGRPGTAPFAATGTNQGYLPDVAPRVWSALPSHHSTLHRVPEAVSNAQLQAGSAPATAVGGAHAYQGAPGTYTGQSMSMDGVSPQASNDSQAFPPAPDGTTGLPPQAWGFAPPAQPRSIPASPGVTKGHYSDMGPGAPLGEEDVDIEYATARQAMHDEYEAEKARMLAELQDLARAQLPAQGSSSTQPQRAA